MRVPLTVDDPSVEVTVLGRGDERCGVVINHAPDPVDTTLRRRPVDGAPETTERLRLEPKGVRLLFWPDDATARDPGRWDQPEERQP